MNPAETGFYYLQSRYYDPETGRFISADRYVSTGQGILGFNMYAYCLNNPVKYRDPSGGIAIIDDVTVAIIMLGVGLTLMILSPPVQNWLQGLAQSLVDIVWAIDRDIEEIVLRADEKVRSLPLEGEPNSDKEKYDDDGTVKQKRHYGEDGKAEYDIDYKHSDDGTHEFPHVHKWTGKTRSKAISFGEFFVNWK